MTSTWKVAPALAFGNTAVLKMSELSPLSAARLGELALEAGIPKGVLNIVHGYGTEVGEPLCKHPDVRAISFTGSTATGNRIVKAAGLKKFSMELGGKSPFVIFDDADLPRALDAAIFMIFSNNGERCTAGSRIFVQQSIYADFVAEIHGACAAHPGRRSARREDHHRPDDQPGASCQGATLHRTRTEGRRDPDVRRARCAGARGRVRKGNFVKPTVFADVANRMRIAQEEIFGPVACLIPFKDEADAIAQANDIPYGLSSYVWSENLGPRASRRRGDRGGHVLRQQPECARPAPAVRRHQGIRRGTRRRHLELRGVPRTEERVRQLGRASHSALGNLMSLYQMQKFLFDINRDRSVQAQFRERPDQVLARYDLTPEEREAIAAGDIGLIYVLGANGQLLMHYAAFLGMPWADYIAAMRAGVSTYGPVRAGIYHMTTELDEKVAGV